MGMDSICTPYGIFQFCVSLPFKIAIISSINFCEGLFLVTWLLSTSHYCPVKVD